ncbi:CNNM domain-containing protein [Roseimarinus sediminis]|jgi:CBS domain containing-hemolysin-like protein|uniref:CNNM domain-containing protein n=1 Tax=Roseimarinus sediminis TaxID=1610899 RepID=UPI003D2010B7
MFLLLLYLALALVISFICSIMESVLLSLPPSFLMVKKEEGHAWAHTMEKLKANIDKPLSAILSLNTVAHTIGAAGVGAQAIKVFGEQWFGLVSAILTILILVITEIIPKTIGARYWRNLTPFAAYTINTMVWITYPLVLMSAVLTRLISRRKSMQSTSREEIAAMASIGANEGVFNEKEYRIIQNMLRLRDVRVTEIMTPRVVVAVANEDMKLSDFLKNKNYLKFSRIPVYTNNEENITGYVFRQTVFEKLAEDHFELKLSDLKRHIVIVHNNMPLFSVWDKLLQKKEHIALIVDEYGGMDGIVTMEDIIETLLGLEIIDEKDTVSNMQQYARERWKTRQAKYNLLEGIQNNEEYSQ